MGGLQRFEQKLEQLISGVFARTFRSAVQPVEIAAALQRECDNNAQVLSRQRRLVPNDFHVELSATDLERIVGLGRALEQDLVDQLQDHADAQGYVFTGPVTIAFESADDLTTGRFRIRSRAQASVTDNDQRTRTRASHATLAVNGTRPPLRPPAPPPRLARPVLALHRVQPCRSHDACGHGDDEGGLHRVHRQRPRLVEAHGSCPCQSRRRVQACVV